MASSVIAFLHATANSSASAIKDQINKAKDLVSEGRYLIDTRSWQQWLAFTG